MAEQTVATTTPQEVEAQPTNETPTTRENTRFLIPPVDIYETADGLTVLADLPGVDRDGIDIRIDNNILTIQGTVTREARGENVYSEFALLDYFRQFELSDRVDQEKISAELKHGVLTLQLPKAEKAKPRQIQVNVA